MSIHKAILAAMTAGTVVLGASLMWAVSAKAWDIDKMNAQIEKTNVIVGGVCSGTVISVEHRLVLTAFHCVDDLFREQTEKIVDPKTGEIHEVTKQKIVPLKISTNKVRDFEVIATEDHVAKVIASDRENDIALIQVVDTDYVPPAAAPLAPDSFEYKRGLKIYAVGNPGITYDNSITEGIISAPQRALDIDGRILKVFQNSASIIGGNSGGALLNDNGEVIGTVSAGIRGANIGFSVPISYTKEMIVKAGFGEILPKPAPSRDRQ